MQPEPQQSVSRICSLEAGEEPRRKLSILEDELNAEILEREDEVRSLVLALIAGEHALLLGPPGTAKSQLARALCGRIEDATYLRVGHK